MIYTNVLSKFDSTFYTHRTLLSRPPSLSYYDPHTDSLVDHMLLNDQTTHTHKTLPNTNIQTYTRMCTIKHSTSQSNDYIHNRIWLPHVHEWLLIGDIELLHHSPIAGAGHFIDIVTYSICDNVYDKTIDGNNTLISFLTEHVTVTLYSDSNTPHTTQCTIHKENDYVRIMQHVPHIIRCELPSRMVRPHSVQLSVNEQLYNGIDSDIHHRVRHSTDDIGVNYVLWDIDTTQHSIRLDLCQYEIMSAKYALCSAPSASPITSSMILQWIDYHLYIGIDIVYIYVRNSTQYIDELQPYIDAGRVEQVYWPLPDINRQSIYYDQSITARHCRATSKYNTDWVLYTDIDEYLVPYQQDIQPPQCNIDNNMNQQCRSMLESQMSLLELGDTKLQSQSNINQQIGSILLPAVEYILQDQSVDSTWLINQYPLRKPMLTLARAKVLSRPQWSMEAWVHSVVLSDGYAQITTMNGIDVWNQSLTIDAQNTRITKPYAMRLHHYASLIVNRDQGFLDGTEISSAADKHSLINDSKFINDITNAIDTYKKQVSWPVKQHL